MNFTPPLILIVDEVTFIESCISLLLVFCLIVSCGIIHFQLLGDFFVLLSLDIGSSMQILNEYVHLVEVEVRV